jgi:hypothetical protein
MSNSRKVWIPAAAISLPEGVAIIICGYAAPLSDEAMTAIISHVGAVYTNRRFPFRRKPDLSGPSFLARLEKNPEPGQADLFRWLGRLSRNSVLFYGCRAVLLRARYLDDDGSHIATEEVWGWATSRLGFTLDDVAGLIAKGIVRKYGRRSVFVGWKGADILGEKLSALCFRADFQHKEGQ